MNYAKQEEAMQPTEPVVLREIASMFIPTVQLTLFEPQVGKAGKLLMARKNSGPNDGQQQRQVWDIQRNVAVKGTLKDSGHGLLSVFHLLRGTPEEAAERVKDLFSKVLAFCKDIVQEQLKSKGKKARDVRADPLILREHVTVYVHLVQGLVGKLYPQTEDGWHPYMWAATMVIAETANQVLGFAGGVTPVVTAFHEQIKNLRFDPEALTSKIS